MELLWYGDWGRPVLAFATSLGGAAQNEDGGLIGGLADKISGGEIQVCCPQSIDEESWYNEGAHPAWKVKRHDQYDRYLSDELVPFIRSKSAREDIITYGASFGAYHAVNFAFRHPELVSRVVAFSGKFDIHQFLDGYWDDTCYFHCPVAYIPNYPPEWIDRLRHMGIVVATGEQDHLVDNTREFAALLQSKGIDVYAEIWPGVFGHDWPFWREHLRRFVP
jgi:esterase/lipase superfamily enzyme